MIMEKKKKRKNGQFFAKQRERVKSWIIYEDVMSMTFWKSF